MKKIQVKPFYKTVLILVMTVAFSMTANGCLEDEYYYEGEENWNENWWEHPGEGKRPSAEHAADEYDEDLEWWNLLDDSWTIDDWEYIEDDIWSIYDEETMTTYLYDEEYQEFAAMDMETEETYLLDMETGDWIPAE